MTGARGSLQDRSTAIQPAVLLLTLCAFICLHPFVAEGTWFETVLEGVLTLVAVAAASAPGLTGMAGVAGRMDGPLPAETGFTT